MLNENQLQILNRLVHLGEFAPCRTIDIDYELQKKGYTRVSKETFKGEVYINTEITKDGVQHCKYLSMVNKE